MEIEEIYRSDTDESDSDAELMDMFSLLFMMRRRRKKRELVKKKQRKAPKFWVREIFQLRMQYGEYHRLIQELRRGDREYFFRYTLVKNISLIQ